MKKWAIIYIVISIFVIIYLIWLNYSKEPEIITKTVTEYQTVEVPRYIVKIKKYPVEVTKVVVIEKSDIVEKEKLPDWLASSTEIVTLNVGDVPPYKGKTRIISLLNIKTGENILLQKQLPYKEPFFEFKKDLRIGIAWDFINQSATGQLNFDFLKISKIHFSLTGEVEKDRVKGGLLLWMKF